jgi:trans-aconitate methyltransferase
LVGARVNSVGHTAHAHRRSRNSLDAISKAVGPSLGAEGTKAVVDWVKSTVLHQAMKDLAANKDIKPI